jgi:L-glyceraldehyde 3-phosphate reductase
MDSGYKVSDSRYEGVEYNRCGQSGLLTSPVTLGLWHNFGSSDDFGKAQAMVRFAFDSGITHYDIANNYGSPDGGSAEGNFGKILKKDFTAYRDEIIITTKAGYYMWPGPYGDGGSKKYLVASLDQSLKRLGLDYVDIFYSHRPDPETPIEETVDALECAVRSGKALYVGISNYNPEQTRAAYEELDRRGIRCLVHQVRYSMLDRRPEEGLLDALDELGMGCVAFSPLEQGILTGRYLNGIPEDSRASGQSVFLTTEQVEARVGVATALNEIARSRGQTLAQMALAWVLKRKTVASVIIGASSVDQIRENLECTARGPFTSEELGKIDDIVESYQY